MYAWAQKLIMNEVVIAALCSVVMGWGTFTWRKAEKAIEAAERAVDRTDKLELKMAEHYLTKNEFEMTMDRLFKSLARMEGKIDYHVYEQADQIKSLRQQLTGRDSSES